ncbi:hypothetical protein KIM372_17580 [Bombiscardovia nodaiensis]|uniref:Transposase n=1 Tax=Bombiscardovia nodaiensis TaxID=2932181 RepID=A0ABM8BAN2_9BIFI|nr:hypothetical protein KIM372_17580 [Bombiscardovia nodaiensis]
MNQIDEHERVQPEQHACEGFFGRMKNEMFHNRGHTTMTQASLKPKSTTSSAGTTPPASNAH